ncbi:MAG: hypothetical protein AAB131_10610 [Actinomycetota bacterium]
MTGKGAPTHHRTRPQGGNVHHRRRQRHRQPLEPAGVSDRVSHRVRQRVSHEYEATASSTMPTTGGIHPAAVFKKSTARCAWLYASTVCSGVADRVGIQSPWKAA